MRSTDGTTYRRPLLLLAALTSASFLGACGAEAPEGEPTVVVTETTVAEPDVGSCDPSALRAEYPTVLVFYCDGEWAEVAIPNSDGDWISRYVDGQWVRYESDGLTSHPLAQACYDEERLERDQMPPELRDSVIICGSPESIYTGPTP